MSIIDIAQAEADRRWPHLTRNQPPLSPDDYIERGAADGFMTGATFVAQIDQKRALAAARAMFHENTGKTMRAWANQDQIDQAWERARDNYLALAIACLTGAGFDTSGVNA